MKKTREQIKAYALRNREKLLERNRLWAIDRRIRIMLENEKRRAKV